MKDVEFEEGDEKLNVMPIEEIIKKVSAACNNIRGDGLALFRSLATGTATSRSDIDFVVYGNVNSESLDEMLEQIETLRKIDIFYYNEIHDEYLLEDIKKYGRKIF